MTAKLPIKDHYALALSLQSDLEKLTVKLAQEIGKRASQRDVAAIERLWHEICRFRPKLSVVHRRLRRESRHSRNTQSRAEYERQRVRWRETKCLDQRLKKWDQIAKLVELHAYPERNALTLHASENESDGMLSLFHRALFRVANPHKQSEIAEEHGCFADIPMDIKPFEVLLRAAYRLLLVQQRAETARFLDIGCGGGTKILAASHYFPVCHGLEYDQIYVKAAQDFLRIAGAEDCLAFQADGLHFDRYNEYDVIYFYRPLRQDNTLAHLENLVFSEAKPGTVILAPYNAFLAARDGNTRPRVKDCVFLAGMTQREIDALHADAECTGPDRVIRPRHFRFDTGFWTPLLTATTISDAL